MLKSVYSLGVFSYTRSQEKPLILDTIVKTQTSLLDQSFSVLSC